MSNSIDREIGREVRQKQRALAIGALVRPPASMAELVAEEDANTAEIDMLSERRVKLWRTLASGDITEVLRSDLRYEARRIAEGLFEAFAAKRKLALARELMGTKRAYVS